MICGVYSYAKSEMLSKTHTHTHKYRNPRCACAPRVNESTEVGAVCRRDVLLLTCVILSERGSLPGKDGRLSIWLPICVSGSV